MLLRPGDTLKYLIKERKSQWGMGDLGESLGAAMEAAMKGSDPDSKRLVVLATQHIADEVKPHVSFDETGKIVLKDPSGLDKLAGIRGSMGRVLAEHSGDIASAFYKRYPRGSGGELTSTFDGRTVAEFGAADLDLTLLDIAGDDRAYQSLLMGQLAHMRGRVDEEVAKGKEGKLGNAITESSKSLGHLLKARELALVGRGKETDAADAAFKKMVDEGIGHIPLPFAAQVGKLGMKTIDAVYETFVKDGYAKAGEWLVKQAGRDGGKTDKALGDTSTNRLAVDELLKQMMESSLVTHGHYEREELKGRFVVGDPPRIKDPRDMTRNEYSAFVEWMKSNSDVPTHFGDAQESLATGMTESETNIGVPEPEKKAHG